MDQAVRNGGLFYAKIERKLDLERAAEAAYGVVGIGAVVICENGVVAAVAKKSTAELADIGRRVDPA